MTWTSSRYAPARRRRSRRADGASSVLLRAQETLFNWATGLGAVNFAHIFYPCRSTGAQIGGAAGMKHDSFVELDHGAPSAIKPIILHFEGKRLFTGETDGSSFPNGGLRATHTAAAGRRSPRRTQLWALVGSSLRRGDSGGGSAERFSTKIDNTRIYF